MPSGRIALIMETTGCNEIVAKKLEDIMRDVVYHSTLDWQTREELQEGARTAYLGLIRLKRVLFRECRGF